MEGKTDFQTKGLAMTDLTVTLTVPYEGRDRTISGSPIAIARAALLIEMGLPTLAEQNTSIDLANLCDESPLPTSMGMGNGAGGDFISGSHTLICAIREVMFRQQPERSLIATSIDSKPWGTGQRRIVARIEG